MPTSSRNSSRASSSTPSATSRIGAPAKSAIFWSAGWRATAGCPREAPCMLCSTVTAWSSAQAGNAIAPPERPSQQAACLMTSGAPTTSEFRLGTASWCYPLTVTDHASRFLLLCEALESTREELAFTAFERLFAERGLPNAIRSDNGVPFASPNALFNLSKLSVCWLRLGIAIERIKPGKPQQNGPHERIHLTLKKETTRPAGINSLQQQAKFDAFVHEFNNQRPHEALNMKYPAEIYTPSPRAYNGLPELGYPFHDRTILVTACGRICLHPKKINISTVLAGQTLGINEIDEGIWLVSFMPSDRGYFDLQQKTFTPPPTPSG